MIFRDSVRVSIQKDVYEWDRVRMPAMVEAVNPEMKADPGGLRDYALARYRIMLAPTHRIPPVDGRHIRIAWRLFDEDSGNPEAVGSLKIEGVVQEFWVGRRLHHYECMTQSVGRDPTKPND